MSWNMLKYVFIKIELSQISTSVEILALLVDALGYKFNEGNLEKFKELNETV